MTTPMKHIYRITEFSSFIPDKKVPGYVTLPGRLFNQLENFLLCQKNGCSDGLDFLSLSARRGLGKIITAKQYVGVIAMNDGSILEILPKIHAGKNNEENQNLSEALLLDMLKTLSSPPFKAMNNAGLKTAHLSILEIFIALFVKEVFLIIKRGVRRGYEATEENMTFFRGKMKFSRQLTINHIHKELFFAEHDSFTPNRPENRLLKTTLQRLYVCSHSLKNKNGIKTLLSHFAEVEASADWTADFARISSGRDMKDYAAALAWSRIFLKGGSFTPFAGPDVALALLFPMDTLFEHYVADKLKKFLPSGEYEITFQDSRHHLFDFPRKLFSLRPDMVITRLSDNAIFILDTKWKRLAAEKPQFGISQSDMYQMVTYQKAYKAEKVLILYPAAERTPQKLPLYASLSGVAVQPMCLDLLQMPNSLTKILRELEA